LLFEALSHQPGLETLNVASAVTLDLIVLFSDLSWFYPGG
jgi:hypothetical protein